ncbi:Remorin 4.2-like protein [Drosera capensis]
MANNQSSTTSYNNNGDNDNTQFRDIHALSPANQRRPRREMDGWDASSHRSHSLSMVSEGPSTENFTTMSREFNALVLAGSTNNNNRNDGNDRNEGDHICTIREEEAEQGETNPLAIVPEFDLGNPVASRSPSHGNGNRAATVSYIEVSVHKVKKEEVEAKISAWQNAKLAKINNRFNREDTIISGQENEEVQKSTLWMQKVERKLEEKTARAMEKMQNDIAKARRKAQEKRASAEARKGTKIARIIELANLMRTVGRAPAKRSFF